MRPERWGCVRRWVVLACAWPVMMASGLGDADAAELRKCAMPNGRSAYVSEACPTGSREVWQRTVDADPQHDVALKRRQDELSQWQQASRREAALRYRPVVARGGSARDSTTNAATRCERARQRRDRIRDKDWMRMTYDRMIQLDNDVAEACR